MYVRGYLQGNENARVVTIDKYTWRFTSLARYRHFNEKWRG